MAAFNATVLCSIDSIKSNIINTCHDVIKSYQRKFPPDTVMTIIMNVYECTGKKYFHELQCYCVIVSSIFKYMLNKLKLETSRCCLQLFNYC